ncbi:MAG: hypothetical protein KDA38_09085, partial [Planctomycetales bacterium]|nr:hypothetical protein [Planctomycetales bacterium]
MGFLRNLAEQLKTLWNQTSASARVGLIAATIVCMGAIAGVGYWSSRPQYVPIASNLGPTEAAEIVSKLDGGGIPNQLNYSGST